MPTSDRRVHLLADDRGAIMVMGIFMCSCLVAALWYLAGIGDAILYRERLQEAADAVAFSNAALHARGMNLIVLVNLVMAVILGIRVALRVAKLILVVAAAIFGLAGILNPALLAVAAPTAAAAVAIDDVDSALKEPIDEALRGLMQVQTAVAELTPDAALLAAKESVGAKYKPVVENVAILHGESLPVERGNPSKLCTEAGRAYPAIFGWLMKKAGLEALGDAVHWLEPIMGGLVNTSTSYFCDLEAGQQPPGTDGLLEQPAIDRCRDLSGEQNTFDDAEKRWLEACARDGVACSSRDPSGAPLMNGTQSGAASGADAETREKNQRVLDQLRLERDQDARSNAEYLRARSELENDGDQCIAWAKEDMKRRQKEKRSLGAKGGSDPSGPSTGSSGIAPMAVRSTFKNGGDEGQIIGGVSGSHGRLRRSAKIVRIGAFHHEKTTRPLDPEPAKMPAWAQAEVFYDCGGAWKECNESDDAMWHFKWRARLRRFNEPTDDTLASLATELVVPRPKVLPDEWASRLAQASTAPLSRELKANAALRKNLAELINDETTRSQGVH